MAYPKPAAHLNQVVTDLKVLRHQVERNEAVFVLRLDGRRDEAPIQLPPAFADLLERIRIFCRVHDCLRTGSVEFYHVSTTVDNSFVRCRGSLAIKDRPQVEP